MKQSKRLKVDEVKDYILGLLKNGLWKQSKKTERLGTRVEVVPVKERKARLEAIKKD